MMLGFGLRLANTSIMHFNSTMSGICVSSLLVARLSVVAGYTALRQTLMAQLRNIGLELWHRDSLKSRILITLRHSLLLLNLHLCDLCLLWLLLRTWRSTLWTSPLLSYMVI